MKGLVGQGQRGAEGSQWDWALVSNAPWICGSDSDLSLEWEE